MNKNIKKFICFFLIVFILIIDINSTYVFASSVDVPSDGTVSGEALGWLFDLIGIHVDTSDFDLEHLIYTDSQIESNRIKGINSCFDSTVSTYGDDILRDCSSHPELDLNNDGIYGYNDAELNYEFLCGSAPSQIAKLKDSLSNVDADGNVTVTDDQVRWLAQYCNMVVGNNQVGSQTIHSGTKTIYEVGDSFTLDCDYYIYADYYKKWLDYSVDMTLHITECGPYPLRIIPSFVTDTDGRTQCMCYIVSNSPFRLIIDECTVGGESVTSYCNNPIGKDISYFSSYGELYYTQLFSSNSFTSSTEDLQVYMHNSFVSVEDCSGRAPYFSYWLNKCIDIENSLVGSVLLGKYQGDLLTSKVLGQDLPIDLPDVISLPTSDTIQLGAEAGLLAGQELARDSVVDAIADGLITVKDIVDSLVIPLPINPPIEDEKEEDLVVPIVPTLPELPDLPLDVFNSLSDITHKFPFCIPFDMVNAFKSTFTSGSKSPPKIDMNFDLLGKHYTFTTDFSYFNPIIRLFREGVLLLFLFGLIQGTRKFISWQND